jgi:HEAT repeat protein
MFRRLEEEERPRIEEATLQLAQAEAGMQERKASLQDQEDRLRQKSAARAEAATTAGEYDASLPEAAKTGASDDWGTMTDETAARISFDQRSRAFAGSSARSSASKTNVIDTQVSSGVESSTVAPAIESYLNSVDPYKRAAAVAELARLGSPDAFSRIAVCFDDHSPHVRNAAARALRNLEPARTVDLFNSALENAPTERRRNIGAAISASGLAEEAIKNLGSENREDTYSALSILFVMAKTGEVAPLVRALEEHGTDDIGKAVSKLLALSGHNSGKQTAGG